MESLLTSAPVPTPIYVKAGLYRWECVDGAVVADIVTSEPGVHFYAKHASGRSRLIDDPVQLAGAFSAAERFVGTGEPPPPKTTSSSSTEER